MSGILDPKTRILDFIITAQGKKALADKGEFVPSFVSFADDKVYYAKLSKTGSVADDASVRLSVQANSFDKDSLFSMSGSLLFEEKSQFTATARSQTLLSNLQNLRILQSIPSYQVGETEFKLSQTSVEFVPEQEDVDIAVTEDLSNLSATFQDKHFQHIDNYKYLPPVNSISGDLLGDYPKLNTDEILTNAALQKLLEFKKSHSIDITGGTVPRNMLLRIFEQDELTNKSSLLEIIDYGSYTGIDNKQSRVFFVGKVFEDQLGLPVFVNIFTMVFS
tara:strand:- start:15 stop:845 length:831 start_codon:yes stop_codon:yes gene_type:complete